MQMDAWNVTIGILQSSTDAEALNFAAITLKGKVGLPRGTQNAFDRQL